MADLVDGAARELCARVALPVAPQRTRIEVVRGACAAGVLAKAPKVCGLARVINLARADTCLAGDRDATAVVIAERAVRWARGH